MEAKICCAYNVSRGCKISSKVIVTDCANSPFKLMKLMLDGLAKDADAGFWLTNLSHAPQIVRLFPFDFVYLDSDLRLVQAFELPPEANLPRFHPLATSALILPLHSLSASLTEVGDTVMIRADGEPELELVNAAAPLPATEPLAVPAFDGSTRFEPSDLRTFADRTPAPQPLGGPPISTPIPAIAVTQGTWHAHSISSSWQISTSTPTGVLLEGVDFAEPESGNGYETQTATSVAEIPEVASPEMKSDPATETPGVLSLTIAEIDSEPKNLVAEATEPVARDASAKTMVEDPAILDTDLATIINAAMAEDLGGNNGAEIPAIQRANAATPELTEKARANARVTESAEPAEKQTASTGTDKSARPAETRPATRVEREKAAAATRITLPIGSRKPDRATARETSAGLQDRQAASLGRGRKRTLGFMVKEFLNCPDPLPESRSAARLVQQGMVAYETNGDASTPMEVRDVSPSGLYLRTKKRWQTKKVFTLTLQRKGASDDEFQSRVNLRVAAIRSDRDGVGLAWVLPRNASFDPWRRVHTKRSDETDLQFFLREIRLTKALAFLAEICPLSTEEIKHALQERFSNKRVASAVEIVLKAEDLLTRNRPREPVLAHSDIVMRILENGSWIEDDWIRRMWAGLLVSSCTADGNDKTNLAFLELMARLTPIHLRILSFVCKKAVETIAPDKPEAKLEIFCTTKELMDAADSHSFQRILQTIGHLSNFGLFQDVMRPSYTAADDKVKTRTTPTPLGFKMYAHCLGQRT